MAETPHANAPHVDEWFDNNFSLAVGFEEELKSSDISGKQEDQEMLKADVMSDKGPYWDFDVLEASNVEEEWLPLSGNYGSWHSKEHEAPHVDEAECVVPDKLLNAENNGKSYLDRGKELKNWKVSTLRILFYLGGSAVIIFVQLLDMNVTAEKWGC